MVTIVVTGNIGASVRVAPLVAAAVSAKRSAVLVVRRIARSTANTETDVPAQEAKAGPGMTVTEGQAAAAKKPCLRHHHPQQEGESHATRAQVGIEDHPRKVAPPAPKNVVKTGDASAGVRRAEH